MKRIFIFFITILSATVSAQASNTFAILSRAQKNIDSVFVQSFQEKSNKPFTNPENDLESITDTGSSTLHFYKTYWLSYLKYKKSVFYLKNGTPEKSKSELSEAIKLLEAIPDKESEVYALLALEQSFNFQFIPQQDFLMYMKKLSENMEKAMALDKNNLRAYYVNASSDFYTPKQYGGGKKAEGYLLKAISLNDKINNSSFAPTWGKELSYVLLIKYYLKKGKTEQAKKYYDQANKLFPNSIYLKSIQTKIN